MREKREKTERFICCFHDYFFIFSFLFLFLSFFLIYLFFVMDVTWNSIGFNNNRIEIGIISIISCVSTKCCENETFTTTNGCSPSRSCCKSPQIIFFYSNSNFLFLFYFYFLFSIFDLIHCFLNRCHFYFFSFLIIFDVSVSKGIEWLKWKQE